LVSSAQVSTTYTYDLQGQLLAADAGGRITAYSYDQASNRTNLAACDTAAPMRRWEAESLLHVIGSSAPGGWRADPANGSGAMSYGPYATDIASGAHVAAWRVKSSQIAAGDSATALTLDVWDATAGVYLATRTIPRSAWAAPDEFQVFSLPFQIAPSTVGHQIELRTWYSPWSSVTLDWIGLAAQGAGGAQVWSCSTAWEAKALSHVVGEAYGDGWSSNGQAGFVLYGPYTTAIPAGRQTAYWQAMITADTTGDQALATLDVLDASTGAVLASRTVTAKTFAQPGKWQRLSVNYDQVGGHATEIRARYSPPGRIIFNQAGVISVTAANPAAPEASNATLNVGYNSAASLALPVSGAVTGLVIDSAPAKGSVSVSATTATYTAAWPNYGADSFTYHATGPGGPSPVRTVSVAIGNPPAPTANDGSASTAFNTPVTITYPVGGDYAVAALDSQPAHGSVSAPTYVGGVGTQSTYTPQTGYVGPDSWTFHGTSPGGNSPVRTFSVNVAAVPVNNPPTAVNDGTISLLAGDTANVYVVGNDTDPDGDPLTVIAISKTTSTKADYDFSGGYITVMAKSSKGGDSLTYTISDGKGGTATATLSINVQF
jgi:hypothetical protein